VHYAAFPGILAINGDHFSELHWPICLFNVDARFSLRFLCIIWTILKRQRVIPSLRCLVAGLSWPRPVFDPKQVGVRFVVDKSVPGQSFWPSTLVFHCCHHFTRECSELIFVMVVLLPEEQVGEAWGPWNKAVLLWISVGSEQKSTSTLFKGCKGFTTAIPNLIENSLLTAALGIGGQWAEKYVHIV
jgi:hypothetical protein